MVSTIAVKISPSPSLNRIRGVIKGELVQIRNKRLSNGFAIEVILRSLKHIIYSALK